MKLQLAFATLALTAASLASAQSDYYSSYFYASAHDSKITIKLSGYCSGSATFIPDAPYARIRTSSTGTSSYFRTYNDELDADFGSDFYSYTPNSTAQLSIKKGQLNFSAKSSSNDAPYLSIYYIRSTPLGLATCKNGQTLTQLLNTWSYTPYLLWDNSLKSNTSLSVKGKGEPFSYKFVQKTSGILEAPSKCTVTGSNSYNLASDTYLAKCKIAETIKVSIVVNSTGKLNYD